MKTRTFIIILILVLAVLLISSCATSYEARMSEVKRLISSGEDINALDDYGYTALMYASRDGYTDIVKLLIEAGADVNAPAISMFFVINTVFGQKFGETLEGFTALMAASEYGHTDIVKLLIEAGADVNAMTEKGVHFF